MNRQVLYALTNGYIMGAMNTKCPNGHASDSADFCSECGIEMPALASAASNASAIGEGCPRCTTERDDPDSPFCGVCGYNFTTRQGGDQVLPASPRTAPSSVSPTASSAPTASVQSPLGPRMDVLVTVNHKEVAASSGQLTQIFSIFDDEGLIGRKSSSIAQTVPIEDEAVSKRHALILRQPDGRYIIRDLGSTNGTKLNGEELKSGVEYELKEGDVIGIGEFTTIKVQAIR